MASVISKISGRSAANDGAGAGQPGAADVASSKTVGQSGEGLIEAVGDLYTKGASLAQDAMDDLPANLSDAGVVGERLLLRGRQRLDVGVRRQPVEALLLAGAIGYLVGWVTIRG